MEFNINYVIDEKYMYYQSKEEMVLDFLYDFYDFVNPEESIKTFIYGIENEEPSWIEASGTSTTQIATTQFVQTALKELS